MVEIGPEFLAAIGGTIALMMLFLMVVVLWDIALALRDVAEKIDYLEDDVDSDLATIDGTLTRIYDRMGTGSATSPVDPGTQAGTQGVGAARNGAGGGDVGQAGGGVGAAAPERTQSPGAGSAVETGAVHAQTGHAGGAGAASGGPQDVARPPTAGAEAGAGSAESDATGTEGAGAEDAADATDAADVDDSSAEPGVDPGAVTPIRDDSNDSASDAVDAETDADDGDSDAEDGTEATVSAGGPSAESGDDGPTPDASGGNVGRFASDGKGGTAWYEVEFDLPPGSRTGSNASPDASTAGTASPSVDDDRERSGEGPFGLQRPGLRSQLERSDDEPLGPTPADPDDGDDAEDAHDPVEAFGGEDIAETTVTDVATVSLAELHHDDADESDSATEAGASEEQVAADEPEPLDESMETRDVAEGDDLADSVDANAADATDVGDDTADADGEPTDVDADASDGSNAPSAVEDVLGAVDAEPPGTDVDELADALESRRADATDGETDEGGATGSDDGDDHLADAAGADADSPNAEADAADEDGGDIADLVNRELDTLTQEVGGTSMTPDVSEEALDGAVDELDEGEYTFPLSGSAFQVGASTDAETATLRFTPENPVELDGARERLLKYQLRNYLDRDDTAHAELSVDGGTVILDIPGADGPAVDAWADAAVQIIDRTLYLSKDDD